MNFLERQIEDPVRLTRIKRCCYVVLAVIVLAEVVLPRVFHGGHSHFEFEAIPAFGSLYGLVSCVAIIVISKFLGKVWLMRREDHYDS